jgi:uncharacterized membrane protein
LKVLAAIKKFFPTGREIALVFGIILFAVHSWSMRAFLYEFPSFILSMNIGQVAGVFAYMMAFAFLESLLALGILLLASALLPRGWYRQGFVSKGFLTVLIGVGFAITTRMALPNRYPGVEFLYVRAGIAGAVLVISILAAHFFHPVQRVLDFLAEQISIMLYIYVPIGAISLLVVIARNLLG